jgi:hypothetical protein
MADFDPKEFPMTARWMALILSMILVREACAAATHTVKVEFLSKHGHTRAIEYAIDAAEAARLETLSAAVINMVARARHDYAGQLGYTVDKYGPDCWKIVPGLRVQRVRVRRADGPWMDVYLR